MRYFINIALVAASVVLIAGCSDHPRGEGIIFVDRPEVFTRERLLNQRLAEQYWLNQQLNRPVNTTFQGYRDVREFEGFYGRAEASLDPTGGAKGDAASITADKDRIAADTERLKALKAREDARRELEKAANPPPPGDAQAGGASGGQSGGAKSQDAGGGSQNKSGESAFASSPTDSAFSKTTVDARTPLSNSGSIAATRASLTSIEMLRDQAAYRNTVQALMREQELDDTHDLRGRTLYTLKFDIGVLAGQHSNAMALVECELEGPDEPSDRDRKNLYNGWVRSLKDTLRDRAIKSQRHWRTQGSVLTERMSLELAAAQRYLDERTRESQLQTLARADDDHKPDLAAWKAADIILTQTGDLTKAHKALTSGSPVHERGIDELLAFATVAPMLRSLSPYVTFTQLEQVRFGEDNYYFPALEGSSEGQGNFTRTIWDTRDSSTANGDRISKGKGASNKNGTSNYYVYTVEPKELAQNISDVSAKETLLNLVASISASAPQAAFASIKAYAEYVHRSQRLLQGILRKPLVVGLPEGEHKFAWVFGPRFQLDGDGGVSFAHTVVQHSVQASIVAPGWWTSLKVKATWKWISEDGQTLDQSDREPVTYCVNLPGDAQAITTFLLTDNTVVLKPQPRVSSIVGNVAPGAARVLIRGEDLWRNPEVYLEAQKADQVQVLPDMNGITALWRDLAMPPGKKGGDSVTVRVVTTGGMDEQSVIFTELDGKPPRPFLALQSTQTAPDVSAKISIRFSVDGANAPAAFANLKLVVSPLDPSAGAPFELTNYPSLISRPSAVTWEIVPPTPVPSWWSSSGRITVQAMIQPMTNGPWMDASGGPARLVHFAAADDAKAELTISAIDLKLPNKCEFGTKLTNADLVLDAFPEFAAAWNAGSVSLRLTHSASSRKKDIPLDGDRRDPARFVRTTGAIQTLTAFGAEILQQAPSSGDVVDLSATLVNASGQPFPVVIKAPTFKVTY